LRPLQRRVDVDRLHRRDMGVVGVWCVEHQVSSS
jgi:hypothetical protein